MDSERRELSAWSLGIMAALFVLTVGGMILAPRLETTVAFAAFDDGLYYPRLAQNLVSRGFCTYDGVTVTNGFHPLWLLVLLPLYAAVSDPWMALRLVFWLIFFLQLGALALLAVVARRWRMTTAGWCVAVFILLLNIRSLTIFFGLLESPLALLGLLSYIVLALRLGARRFESPWAAGGVGMVLGLCFLARLDAFLLSVAYALVWLVRAWRRTPEGRVSWRAAAAAAGGCLLLAAPYLLWNARVFGHLQTVSAWQKTAAFSPLTSWRILSGWARHQFIPRVQHVLGWEALPPGLLLSVLAGLGIAGAVYLLTGARRGRLLQALGGVSEFPIFVGLHAIFIVLVAPQDAAASAWYWTPEIALAALAVGVALPDMRLAKIPLVPCLVIAFAVVQWAAYPRIVSRKTMTWTKLEIARYLREQTPAATRGMMFDSGIVSYFSQRDFVGLNGLIGDFPQARLMRARRYEEAAARYGVGVLVLDTPVERLPALAGHARYISKIRTKFENFNEPPKPFVVYEGTPAELAQIWQQRYAPQAGGR